jgi:hypothetical protein
LWLEKDGIKLVCGGDQPGSGQVDDYLVRTVYRYNLRIVKGEVENEISKTFGLDDPPLKPVQIV